MKDKNFSIEFLRIVFMMYIVMRHSLAAAGIFRDNCLWIGVEFFFVLSGFLLTTTFSADKSIWRYVVERYVRFAPLTALGCALCALIVTPDLLSLVSNILLLSETGSVVFSGASNPPTWYLSVLVWGGTLYLLLFKYCRAKYFVVALMVIVGLSLLRKHGYEPVNGGISIAGVPHRFVRGVAEMGVGCAAAMFFRRDILSRFSYALMSMLEVGTFLVAIVGPFAPIWNHPGCITLLVLNDALLIGLFMSKSGCLSRLLNMPFWGELSQYVLALFCTHYVTTFAIEKTMMSNAGLSVRSLMVGGALLGSVVLSIVSRKFIEIPCAKFLRCRFDESEILK